MEAFEVDVVVVGGGLSGLASAYYLLKKDRGLRVLVLEAKDRIGGRTETNQLLAADGTKDFWDLGGEWVGRPQIHLQFLLRKFHMDTFNPVAPHTKARTLTGPKIAWRTRLDILQFSWKLEKFKKTLVGIDISGSVEALKWDGITFEKYRDENLWTVDGKDLVDAACRCMFGLSPSEMTLLYFLKYINSAGGLNIFFQPAEYTGRECRVKGGVQQLATHLMNKIGKRNVRMNQPVTHIVQTGSTVTVITDNRLQVQCQRVVMAIPPHHAAAIKYTPPLPSTKLNLLRSVPIAFLVKFAITFDEAFWMNNGPNWRTFGFQSVLDDVELGPVGIVYDATSARGNPALAGFLSSAVCLEEDLTRRQNSILDLLESVLGPNVRKFIDFSQKDWSKEPFNGGCFLKSLIPGTTKYFNQDLREPFERIHFAGTEMATIWCGFMNGAIQSGFRAATEVLSHVRPQIITSPDPGMQHFDSDSQSSVSSYLRWGLLFTAGVGAVSVAYLLWTSEKSTARSLANSIRLVLESK
ncbi:probable flavin-containing monoamine oxidase A [Gigantopelta aegis]|uniref:probable flavin-containing monoamine oxidase A n=1 Tax=Gigantopelta aegis TaxID=1735272 RepID=UPI001B88DBB5|nr:probable flavin-containing monoamine oxidase A [Gigantopelta aegis]